MAFFILHFAVNMQTLIEPETNPWYVIIWKGKEILE